MYVISRVCQVNFAALSLTVIATAMTFESIVVLHQLTTTTLHKVTKV